ncbi:MAG: tetratricopeptide repeat protein [Myxococcales bacterium]|nr:tetratricopeptide repeat protein [Myxococcales bacterium]
MLFPHLLVVLAAADALGLWSANGARLELKDEGGKVVGRLAEQGGPCPVPPGTELLKGTLLDDSLSAQVRLCVVAEKCGAVPDTALAVLLVTRTLTGGVHTRAPCAQEVHALVLRRPGPPMAMTPPAPAERLSKTEPPRSPRSLPNTRIAFNTKLSTDSVAAGEIPGRPVGEPRHPPGYDPRDARNTPKIEAQKLLVEGAAFLQEGHFERARGRFEQALQKDPQRAEAYNGVGVTFYARGDLDEALAWYKRSLEADPRFGDAYYNMACVYALQERRDLAFRYLRMAALSHYSEREAMEKDPDLASLRADPQWREILDQMRP